MSKLCVLTPIGWLRLREESGALIESVLVSKPEEEGKPSPLLLEARRQLDAYFRGELTAFRLPIAADGTAFEKSVWSLLGQISYGQTRTYGEMAALLGKPGAARAVGRACARNPLLVIVPCHRVIGSNGKMTGFAAGLKAKRTLLALEGIMKDE